MGVVPLRIQTMLIGLPSGAQKWSTAREMPRKGRSPTELETTLVPKDELMAGFLGYQRLLSGQIGMPHYTMPISRALLVAEKIVTGQLSPQDVLTDITLGLKETE